MSTAVLTRQSSIDQGTFGVLEFGQESLFTVELPWRENRVGLSCIPVGVYKTQWGFHSRFGGVVRLLDVPGRAGILIHAANFGGDAALGYVTQLQGCIALGLYAGMLRTSRGTFQRAVMASQPAVRQFNNWVAGRNITLEVR